jgi:hypothetical protein
MEFLSRLKPPLAARPNANDNLLTISFGTPAKKNYVIALGFPTPQTIALAESLFEKPPVTLTQEELMFARQEVTAFRRNQGISDRQASEHALKQARELGLSEPFAQSLAGSYAQDLTAEALEPVEPAPGSSVYPVNNLKEVPYNMRAQLAKMQADVRQKHKDASRPYFVRYRAYVNDIPLDDIFDVHIAVYKEILRTVNPYLLTESAMKLFQAVWEADKQDFPIPDRPTFLELATPIEMPYGTIKALSIYCMRVPEAVEQVQRRYRDLADIAQFRKHHEFLYRVDVLAEDMQILTAETYDAETQQWVYLPNHQCPTQECTTAPGQGYGSGREDNIVVLPCNACRVRTVFWASWVRTALLMIDREYAVSANPETWQTQVATWDEQGMQKVGKGKNARMIKATRKRHVEYKVVSFDISQPETSKPASTTSTEPGEEKRPNWLTLASKDQIIYERKRIAPYTRHYQKQEGAYTVVEHSKYVPMLRDKPPTIKKVIASAYEQKGTETDE